MKTPKIFHGYWILVSCFICILVTIGSSIVTFGLFVKAIQKTTGWGRTEIMAAFTLFLVVTAIASPFAGRLIERFGARKIITLGALLLTAGFALLGVSSNLWLFYIGYGLIGLGFSAGGHITLTYVTSLWFYRRRGMAIGIMSAGAGASSLIFVPLFGVLLIPRFGWNMSYLILALINAVVVIPLSLLVIRTRPSDMGLYPDGEIHSEENLKPDSAAADNTPNTSRSMTLKGALQTSAFWLIALSLFFNHTHLGVLQNAFPHLRDMGFSAGLSASILVINAATVALSMFFFGWLCDKIKARYAAALGLVALGLGILIFSLVTPRSPVLLPLLYAVVMGFGVGSWIPTMSMLTSATFGMTSYATIFGIFSIFQNGGGAIGPLIAGYVYDMNHDYLWAFIIIGTMVALAIPSVLLVRKPAGSTQ